MKKYVIIKIDDLIKAINQSYEKYFNNKISYRWHFRYLTNTKDGIMIGIYFDEMKKIKNIFLNTKGSLTELHKKLKKYKLKYSNDKSKDYFTDDFDMYITCNMSGWKFDIIGYHINIVSYNLMEQGYIRVPENVANKLIKNISNFLDDILK